MSFGGRLLATSERAHERTAYIPLGEQRPREILIGEGSSMHRKARKRWTRQRICVVCGFTFLALAIGALFTPPARPVTDNIREFAIETWDGLATGTSWFGASGGPFRGAGAITSRSKDVVHLVKSSSARAPGRLSWHVLWPRPDLPKRIFYSDAQRRLGNTVVINALENTTSPIFRESDEFKEYERIHQNLANHAEVRPQSTGSTAQRLDKWKMFPMLAHAWTVWPGAKWYVVSEDDTYIFASTLNRWLSQWNSSDYKYMGFDRTAGNFLNFADVAAGFVLSRRIMSETFGSSPTFHTQYDALVKKWTCGDCALADVLHQQPGMRSLKPFGGQKLFLTDNVRKMVFNEKVLYTPVLSVHKNDPADLQGLRVFEEQLLPTLDANDGVRYCDILEHFAPATLGRTIQMNLMALDEGENLVTSGLDTDTIRSNWFATEHDALVCGHDCADSRHVPFDNAFCAALCEENAHCLAWTLSSTQCVISRDAFRLGGPMVNVTTGWKVGRIATLMHGNPCKDRARRKALPIASPWAP
ncbi:hypothetical protein V8E36_004502 [Tilletia maclaganii]